MKDSLAETLNEHFALGKVRHGCKDLRVCFLLHLLSKFRHWKTPECTTEEDISSQFLPATKSTLSTNKSSSAPSFQVSAGSFSAHNELKSEVENEFKSLVYGPLNCRLIAAQK